MPHRSIAPPKQMPAEHVARWDAWQAGNALSAARSDRHMRLLAAVTLFVVIALLLLLQLGRVSAQGFDLSRYREFTLGSSVEAVTAVTRSAAADVKTVHAGPRLVQELAWSPRYTPGGAFSQDSARDIRFHFVDDKLFRIDVVYDSYRLQGLTASDIVAGVTAIYGTPTSRGGGPAAGSLRPAQLARWQAGDLVYTLSQETLPSLFRLVAVDVTLERAATVATVEAQRLAAIDAPRREAEARATAAATQRDEDAARRETNKAGFRP
jgi:hypothetical protein